MPSLPEPPDDQSENRAWIDEQAERVAVLARTQLRKIVLRAYDAYLSTLTAAGDLAAFDSIPQEWGVFVGEQLLDEIDGVYRSGAVAAWNQAPTTAALGESAALAWAAVVNEDAVSYAAQASNRLAGVGHDIWMKVNSEVTEAIRQGTGTEALKNEIERLTGFSEFRADTIARTEIGSAFVNGNYEAQAALGEYGAVFKEWLAVSDARTRPEHAALDGTVIPFEDMFDAGGEMMRAPHDETASAGNVINCRCDVLWYYPGDTLPDGTLVEAPTITQGTAGPEVAEELGESRQEQEAREARERRLEGQRRYYQETRATAETATDAARRFGVSTDQVIANRAAVAEVRAAIRASAAQTQVDLYGLLQRTGTARPYLPKVRNSAFDPLKLISNAERTRYMRWFDHRSVAMALEDMADNARKLGMVDRNWTDDQVLEWHRDITRRIDAAGAVARGRLPSSRLYNDIDFNDLAPVPDIDVRQILGSHVDDSAGYLAQLDKARYADQAYSALGPSVFAEVPPWRMGFASWWDEVLSQDFTATNGGPGAAAARSRLAELIPPQFDVPGASAEELYGAIVQAARLADLEVADFAVIPWE